MSDNLQTRQRRAAARTALVLGAFALGCYITFLVTRL